MALRFPPTIAAVAAFSAISAIQAGCGRILEYEAPPGFAAADHDWRSAHYKASDNVGLKLLVFDNVDGGTLDYWAADLTRKLEGRGYVLGKQAPLTSSNRVAGTRADFVLDRQDGETAPQFLVVSLFVTDKYRYVAQIAGAQSHYAMYDARVPELLGDLRPKGCRARSKICKLRR
jgi:hypothetical protein